MVLVNVGSCFVVLITGCTEEEVSKHYEADGISFNYSESWFKADVRTQATTRLSPNF
jgi:uncharacterized lipoprotein YehR (DUF1307 family)